MAVTTEADRGQRESYIPLAKAGPLGQNKEKHLLCVGISPIRGTATKTGDRAAAGLPRAQGPSGRESRRPVHGAERVLRPIRDLPGRRDRLGLRPRAGELCVRAGELPSASEGYLSDP